MVPPASPEVPVHEIRDYQQVNALVAGLLDRGNTRVRLLGVSGQRLLLSGLRGGWRAVVEVDGPAGPELAAGLEAPGLIVVAHGGAAAGAAGGMRAGGLVIQGPSGDALAYRLAGGTVAAVGPVGHRAGLELRDGVLLLGGPTGRLAGERQRGGLIVALDPALGPHAGHARLGGLLIRPGESAEPDLAARIGRVLDDLSPFLPPGFGRGVRV